MKCMKQSNWMPVSSFLILLLVGICGRMDAQVLYGTIVGSVTDQSGAAVPGVSVIATETRTNAVLTTTTDAAGSYAMNNVPSGTYTIRFSRGGFQAEVAQNVTVTLNATTRVNGDLKVGSVSETVTVSASSIELQTDRADVHQNLNSSDLENLPAPVRSYQNLIGTMAGAGQVGAGGGGTNNPTKGENVELNGTSNTSTDYRIEGVSAVDAWVPFDSTARPSVEAIESVNVVAGTADVEQGLASGAKVNVQLKSGTNHFHGVAYWYHTDNALKAHPYFSAPGSRNSKAIENDAGGTLGGPILRNKLFFFVSYEGDFTSTDNLQIGTVPLPSVLAGNFQPLLLASGNPDPTNGALCNPVSGTAAPCIFDPTTGNPDGTGRSPFFATPATNPQCPSGVCYNMIPTSRLSSVNAKLDALVPGPNRGGTGALTNNYQGNTPNKYNLNLIDAKVDWNATSKLRVSGRLEIDPYRNTAVPLFGSKLGSNSNGGYILPLQNGMVTASTGSFTYTKSATFLIDGGFGFTRSNQLLQPIYNGMKETLDGLGIPGTNLGSLPYASGLASMEIGCGVYYDQEFCGGLYSGYGEAYAYLQYLDPVFSYFSNFTKIVGKHTLKFGFNIVNQHMNHYEHAPDTISYDGGVTADADPNQPWSPWWGISTLANSYADFELGTPTAWYTQELNQIGGQKMTELRSWNNSLYFGDTFAASEKLTVSLGSGWEYYPVPTHGNHGLENFVPGPNGTGTYEVCGIGAVPKDCGIRVSKLLFTPRAGFAFRPMNNLVIRGGYGIANDQFNIGRGSMYNTPEVLNYSASNGLINPFFPVGSLSAGIPIPVSPNYQSGIISPLPVPFDVGGTILPINYQRGYVQSYNLTVQKTIGIWSAQAGYVGTHSLHMYAVPDLNYCPVGSTGNCEQYFPVFGTLTENIVAPLGSSHYNSLQAVLKRSFSGGNTISANYTYSQWLGICCSAENAFNTGFRISDPRYMNLSRGTVPGELTHVFNLTAIVSSPFGKGKTFFKDGDSIGAAILGGWQLNGVFTARSGAPITFGDGNISAGNSQLPSYANGASAGHVSYPKTLSKWFDPKDFTAKPTCQGGVTCFGNVRIDSVLGPGAVNVDLGLFREIPIRDSLKAQIRVEAFNVSNTPHFGQPDANVADPGFGSISGVNPVNRLVDERYLRLGVKFLF